MSSNTNHEQCFFGQVGSKGHYTWRQELGAPREITHGRSRPAQHEGWKMCASKTWSTASISRCPSRSCWRTEQVQPLQWEHGVWPCAAAAADSKWREVPEQVGREAHKRVVFAPVVVSAMFKTRLLGAANMEQVNWLYTVTCVMLLVQLVCRTTHYTWCHVYATARAIAQQHVIHGALVLAIAKTNTVICMYAQRGVSMGVLVNAHFCGVGVRRATSAGVRRHQPHRCIRCLHSLTTLTCPLNQIYTHT